MRLRPSRAPVTRLSRKVLHWPRRLVAGARHRRRAVLCACSRNGRQTAGSELYDTDNRNTPDGLANLPRDYAGLAETRSAARPAPSRRSRPADPQCRRTAPGMPPAPPPDPEKQRVAQEQEAARTSHLFATTNVSSRTLPRRHQRPPVHLRHTGQRHRPIWPRRITSSPFSMATSIAARSVPIESNAPASPYVLQAGAVIPAALLTGLRSDLPGQVTAQVTEDVYDSPTGKILSDPPGRPPHRPVRCADRLRAVAGAAGLEPAHHAERPVDRAGAPARRRRRRLCRSRGRGRQSLGHAVQGGHPLDAAQRRLGGRHQRQRERSGPGHPPRRRRKASTRSASRSSAARSISSPPSPSGRASRCACWSRATSCSNPIAG